VQCQSTGKRLGGVDKDHGVLFIHQEGLHGIDARMSEDADVEEDATTESTVM